MRLDNDPKDIFDKLLGKVYKITLPDDTLYIG